jgi:tripartite-type tricarboxylate transporter receptor subunit TctC
MGSGFPGSYDIADAKTMNIARVGLSVIVIFAATFTRAQPQTQPYPSKQIRYVVPFPAGAITDILARLIGQKLNEAWGQQVIVENRTGATGTIGSDIVAKAPPDGYTMLGGTVATHSISSSLYRNLPYHPLKDFVPVTRLATLPNVLVVHPSMPVRTVKQFAAMAKTRPGELRFGSGGSGTTQHLSGELFNMLLGTKLVHVPYKGGNLAMIDLIGGQIELGFENAPNCVPYIKGGKLRALGVTTTTRAVALPDVPPIAESIPGFEVTSWQGLFLPAGTPAAIVTKLNAEVRRIFTLPDVRDRVVALGAEVGTTTPEAFVGFIRAEMTKWEKVVKASGAQLD